jgi:hypothetical protein
MIRATLAVLAVLIIPACDFSDHWGSDHELSISNDRSSSVWVEISYCDDDGWGDTRHDDYSLGSDRRRVDSFAWYHRVDVRITGEGGALIFSRTYTPDDFEDHDDRISIVVTP